VWDANPVQNVLPLNWVEITRSLQTLWMREMSDPARAMQRAADFNAKLFGATMDTWREAAIRFWGLETRQGDEEEGRPDKRFSAPDWEQNPFYETLKESYLLASEFLLKEARRPTGRTPRSSGASSSTSDSSSTRWRPSTTS
jgi:polyhydroxyalkanoate synthase